MNTQISEPDFLTSDSSNSGLNVQPFKTQLHCAVIVGEIKADEIEALATAGVEGVETTASHVDVAKAIEARHIVESNGLRIHSIMCSANLAQEGESAFGEVERLKNGLRIAHAYGASSVLCVPGRADDPGVKPKDFQIEFDPDTCLVSRVCAGDQAPYAKYIEAQNQATLMVQRNLPKVLSVAAYEGVTIGLENVWNNLWCSAELYAAFIHSFDNLRVRSYFDLGNYVKYVQTEKCLRALGKDSIIKLHFKDYLLDANGGHFVPVGQGSNDWFSIRKALDDIGYSGFVTIEFEEGESRKLTTAQHVRKFKNFFNGIDINDGV